MKPLLVRARRDLMVPKLTRQANTVKEKGLRGNEELSIERFIAELSIV
jgi:hypothetical protein